MYYSKIRINDYKSYFKSETIIFDSGINLIIGKNNSGKTSLLEVLSGNIESKPHLNIEKKPRSGTPVKKENHAAILEFLISKEEVFELIEDKGNNCFNFFNDKSSDSFLFVDKIEDDEGGVSTGLFRYEFNDGATYGTYHIKDSIIIQEYEKHYLSGMHIQCFLPLKHTIIQGLYKNLITSGGINVVQIKNPHHNPKVFINKSSESSTEISQFISKEFFEARVYKFDIHRTVIGKSQISSEKKLYPNCSNFPSVLDCLQSDRKIYAEYVELIKVIFPDIKDVSVVKEDGANIKIWMNQSTRPDLAIPLSDCGTGVGQVMAMLYVVISSHNPQVIIIDEPNSFLHPSASRKLIEIFKKYSQHQYIISTHSPEIISAANPENIILLRLNENGQTQIQKIDRKSREHMQQILEEVGGRLSDVFGYDQILWVEGETEEICFPKIVEQLLDLSLTNSPIRRVYDTGSFENKHIRTTLYIYRRLVEGDALIPPSLAFIFDKEGRNDRDIQDLEREGKGKIHLLKRRLYENYLLDYEAIEAVLKSCAAEIKEENTEVEWVGKVSSYEIEEFIKSSISDKKFWDNKNPPPEKEAKWQTEIHASKLLDSVFSKFTDGKVPYRKTTHSVQLTEWLIENKPQQLKELKDLLEKVYQKER